MRDESVYMEAFGHLMLLELILVITVSVELPIVSRQVVLVGSSVDSCLRRELFEVLGVDGNAVKFVWVWYILSFGHFEELWDLMLFELVLIVAIPLKLSIAGTQVVLVGASCNSGLSRELFVVLDVDGYSVELVWVWYILSLFHFEEFWDLVLLELVLVIAVSLELSVAGRQVVLVGSTMNSCLGRKLLKVLSVDGHAVKLVWVLDVLSLCHLKNENKGMIP
jgi:hypothetical protein